MSNTETRKLTIVRTPTQPLRVEPGEAVHVGVDVHKASSSVALYSDGRGLITTWVQPARPELLLERLRPLREGIARVVYEAGPTGFGLAPRLRAEGYKAQVIAPSKLLAQLSAKGLLHPVRVPAEQEEADRQVLRTREQLVRKTRSVQSQIKSFLLQHGIAEPAGLAQTQPSCHEPQSNRTSWPHGTYALTGDGQRFRVPVRRYENSEVLSRFRAPSSPFRPFFLRLPALLRNRDGYFAAGVVSVDTGGEFARVA